MSALSLPKLKAKAIKEGMDRNEARGSSEAEIKAFLSGGKSKPVKKARAVKKASATRSTRKPATRKAPARKVATRKPNTRKAPARATAASSRSTTAGRKPKVTAKPRGGKPKATTRKSNSSKASDVGWKLIGKLSFTNYDKADWNPRPDSGVGIIFKALKQAKGNRERAYEMLKGQINKLSPKTSRLGTQRTAQEQRDWLKYRINQTLFNFARATGQHESGTNRKPYEANGKPKARAASRARAAKPATSRRASTKAASKPKPKATPRKAAQRTSRRRTAAGRR